MAAQEGWRVQADRVSGCFILLSERSPCGCLNGCLRLFSPLPNPILYGTATLHLCHVPGFGHQC